MFNYLEYDIKFIYQKKKQSLCIKLKGSVNQKKNEKYDVKTGAALAGAGLAANSISASALENESLFKLKDGDKLLNSVKGKIKDNGLNLRKATALEKIELNGKKNAFYSPKTKEVVDAGLGHRAEILAHELGHHKVQTSKHRFVRGTQGSLGDISRVASMTGLGIAGSVAAGVAAGKNAARKEAAGEKEGKLSKYGHYAVAVGSTLPMLASEAMASGHGLRILKKAGASKGDLARAAANLGVAGATYGSMAAINAGAGSIAKGLAKKSEMKKIERKNKK